MFRRYILRVISELLADPRVQEEIFDALDREARKTQTKLDDQALEIFRALFKVALPTMFARG